jgi:aminoglycoside phosphotransferase (APT) family kinase protein
MVGRHDSLAERIADQRQFAIEVAQFLLALQRIGTADGPPAGPHSFFRGGPLSVYDAETRQCLGGLTDEVSAVEARAVWDQAMAATWRGPAVWVHGDIAAGNLLVRNGRLGAIIDFGSCAVGDPACDLAVAWTLLTGVGRAAFRRTLSADEALWARARGWALWKALLTIADTRANGTAKQTARRTVAEVVADARSGHA